MKQGEIWLADLNPVAGSEQQGTRPVVVISGNAMNDNLSICIVCPLSSKLKHYAGCLILTKDSTNGLDNDSEVITFQIRTISGERLIRKLGEITALQIEIIKKGLSEILNY
ncbi:MAG: type II toxin-antitoxin system PemK/MazF family toxin [Bacteroidetes bacterium]|nr:type II toxin-antitoxin system PemK/MazF family toxin [Bacteroidota bacterium]